MVKVSKERIIQKLSDLLNKTNDLEPNFVELAITTSPEEQPDFKLYDFDTVENEFSNTLKEEYPDGDIELTALIVTLLDSEEDLDGEEIVTYELLEEDFI